MPKEVIDEDFGYLVTERFLRAVSSIMGNRDHGKQTQQKIGDVVGISSSNINRMRSDPTRRVTVDACARLCYHFKVSTHWLLLGEGQMYSNDELMTAYNNLEKRLSGIEKSFNAMQKELDIIKQKIKK